MNECSCDFCLLPDATDRLRKTKHLPPNYSTTLVNRRYKPESATRRDRVCFTSSVISSDKCPVEQLGCTIL